MTSAQAGELVCGTQSAPRSGARDDVLVRVQGVSKKFCRSLRKSLWYGVRDIFHELNPLAASRPSDNGYAGTLRKEEFWAVDDVSFDLRRGECLGLIGHNGAGKTTLLKMLNGLIKPDVGEIRVSGRIGALIALGAGFNPVLTGRENVFVNASMLGLSRRQINERIDEIVEFSEIGQFIDSPVQNYSSGMRVRLGFAVASSFQPDVLILDEVLAVGDSKFRQKCINRMRAMQQQCAVVFVSHSEPDVRRMSTKSMLMDRGRRRYCGDVDTAFTKYAELGSPCGGGEDLENTFSNGLIIKKAEAIPDKIDFGESMVIRIATEAASQVSQCHVRIPILELSGERLAEWNSIVHGTSFSFEEGAQSIDIVLDSIRLRPGRYLAAIEIADSLGYVRAKAREAFAFQVRQIGFATLQCAVQL